MTNEQKGVYLPSQTLVEKRNPTPADSRLHHLRRALIPGRLERRPNRFDETHHSRRGPPVREQTGVRFKNPFHHASFGRMEQSAPRRHRCLLLSVRWTAPRQTRDRAARRHNRIAEQRPAYKRKGSRLSASSRRIG